RLKKLEAKEVSGHAERCHQAAIGALGGECLYRPGAWIVSHHGKAQRRFRPNDSGVAPGLGAHAVDHLPHMTVDVLRLTETRAVVDVEDDGLALLGLHQR